MGAFALLALLFAAADDAAVDAALKRFVGLYAAVEANAAEPIAPAQAFYEGAIPGMLRRLDPHSIFFDPLQFEQLRELESSTRKGFGTVVSILPGRVIVLQTLPGTPSAKAGMSPGDEIVAINGIPLATLEVEQLIALLTQSRQRQVRLDVRRPGNARLLPLLLTPEEVDSPSVDRAFLLRPAVGYIRATSFDAPTGKQIAEAIEKLGGAALKGLVLDLRNNPGGMLPAALDTVSLFIEPGKRILTIRGRAKQAQEIDVPAGAKPYSFAVAVLVNQKSASGSEIVAGAVQDHKRGVVIGEPTFGKGLVQSVYPLSQSTGLALTTAFYYTPSGRSIQRHLTGTLEESTREGEGGIKPDRVVYPEPVTRLRAVMEATASFTSFATDYLQRNRIPREFDVTGAVLDEFQAMLSGSNIRPGIAEWSSEREWIRSRLKQEILTQAFGVAAGDEVEAQIDPVVRAAVAALGID